MLISRKLIVNFTVVALAVGFLSLLAIVGATIWLGERAQVYFDGALLCEPPEQRRSNGEALQSAESSLRIGGSAPGAMIVDANARTSANLLPLQ